MLIHVIRDPNVTLKAHWVDVDVKAENALIINYLIINQGIFDYWIILETFYNSSFSNF